MESHDGARRRASARRWFELEPPAPERLRLETSPRVSTVASYVLTRAAERSWEVLNQHLAQPQGAVFWIGGPAGCGKTHFLDYVIALQRQAGALDAQNIRCLVCGLELSGRMSAAEVELFLLSVLAEQIGGDPRSSGDLFRQMRGAAALNVGLETARRTGIRAITVAIDFGTSQCESAADFFKMLAQVAASFSQVKFTVIAAGRAMAPEATRPLAVAPRDADEETIIAVRRARRLVEDAELDAGVAYAGIDTAGMAPAAIFPFHPVALSALRAIAIGPKPSGENSDAAAIVSLSRLAREALSSPIFVGAGGNDGESPARLIYPPDLTMNAVISNQVKAILADAGRAAWKIARDRIADLDGYEKDLAREIIDSLIMENVCGGTAALAIEELKSRVPMVARGGIANERAVAAVRELLRRLEVSTGGVIRFETDAARFDPQAAGAPELAAFNAVLELARRFDPRLTLAHDREGLDARLKRLEAVMADAVEAAIRTRIVLATALAEANLEMPAANRTAIAEYIGLAESGAAAMLEAAADRAYLASAIRIAGAYEAIAAACESIPRMRSMREFLTATGLRAAPGEAGLLEGAARESAVVSLETECELLRVELGPRILTGPPRSLDALEARFQKFKWTYVQCYLSAHARWRVKMERLELVAGDARRYFDALTRLNAIAALGPPEGEHLGARVAELGARVVRCELKDAIAPETTPRCSSCGFQLGAASPQAELEEAMEGIRRALEIKLAALSQSMIARLIRIHDREHRLEGFLKITQAAQTDALVRVLDEKLARYLAQVLDENETAGPGVPRLRRLRSG
ncbi:MAG: hypothetical protein WCE23_16330 [Candidatus Binatus sp.]|uniref:hypothetical protein n=1 Tax=Candidatus Binatus sp. TaxID=2811406 RepID=UPI003C73D86F